MTVPIELCCNADALLHNAIRCSLAEIDANMKYVLRINKVISDS